jgi:hypothetical protein
VPPCCGNIANEDLDDSRFTNVAVSNHNEHELYSKRHKTFLSR